MIIVFSILGLAFVAFAAVWLVVRIVPRRGKGADWLWMTVLLVALSVYILNVGPVSVVLERGMAASEVEHALFVTYLPLFCLHDHAPKPIHATLEWYAHLWGA